ncbi:myotubularin, putative [Trypanosoma equiperdum]|uniref:Myotubularin, putative n=1 Tax=Trypanosoma equiperdum TaxID=5694 RepID=A0A1G4I2A6_TRYEQ|nr:myotubularin, putative [Trypanosoma equiperdum]
MDRTTLPVACPSDTQADGACGVLAGGRDGGEHHQRKQSVQPSNWVASPIEMILLKCVLGEVEGSSEELQWQRMRLSGLGPSLLVLARRVELEDVTETDARCYALEVPPKLEVPPVVRQLLASTLTCGDLRVSLQFHWAHSLETSNTPRRNRMDSPAPRFVFFVKTDRSVTIPTVSSVLLSSDGGSKQEQDTGCGGTDFPSEKFAIGESTRLLLTLLRQTSLWNMAFLNHSGVQGSFCNVIQKLGNHDGKTRQVEQVVQAICYLHRVLKERQQEEGKEVDNLMEIIFGWSQMMHETLSAPISTSARPATDEISFLHVREPTCYDDCDDFGPPKTLQTGRGTDKGERTSHAKGTMPSVKALTPPSFIPTMLRSVSTWSAATSTLGAEESVGDVSSGQQQQQMQEELGNIADDGRRVPEVKQDKELYPVLSVCTDVLVDAFHLQGNQQHVLKTEWGLGDGRRAGTLESSSAAAYAATSNSLEEQLPAVTKSDSSDDNEKAEHAIAAERGSNTNSTIKTKCSGAITGGFLPSLTLRLASGLFSPDVGRQYRRRLSALARGDFFPSRRAMEKADLLQRRLQKTTKVWFYDLFPQHLLAASDATTNAGGTAALYNSGTGLSPGGVGVKANSGHPCYLYLTETDIILASAFDNINRRQASVGRGEERVALRTEKTSRSNEVTNIKSRVVSDSERSGNSDNTNEGSCEPPFSPYGSDSEDNPTSHFNGDSSDSKDYIRLRLVFPRVSLADVQWLTTRDGTPSTVLLLQTRACRRVWLAFHGIDAVSAVHSELIAPMTSSYGNRLLASARRPWRMVGLVLTAGDVLPNPYTPFYLQVIRNILTAFVDLEERGGQKEEERRDKRECEYECEDSTQGRAHHWWLYSVAEEFERQDIPLKQWRITDINIDHKHFTTYPERFVVPNSLHDDRLLHTARLRGRGRVEALSFYYSASEAGLVRAAQPAVIPALYASAASAKALTDPVEEYRNACMRPVHIFDLRSGIRALSSTLVGGGFSLGENRRFCSLENIHHVRESYDSLCEEIFTHNPNFPTAVMKCATAPKRQNTQAGGPTSSLAQLRAQENQPLGKAKMAWVEHIRGLLRTAEDAARLVAGVSEENALFPAKTDVGTSSTMYMWMRAFHSVCRNIGGVKSAAPLPTESQQIPSYTPLQSRKDARLVMVNCSDGWDRTPQVCALSQLLLDPYYRTVEGFLILVEKEFVAFGHPFATRSTCTATGKKSQWDTQNGSSAVSEGSGNCNNGGGNGDTFDEKESSSPSGSPHTLLGGKQNSPIMLQFIDAVYQLLRIYPHCFEFTENFLLLIVDILNAGIVGTFAVNCEADIKRWGVEKHTLSLSQLIALVLATTIPTEGEQLTSLESSIDVRRAYDDGEYRVTNASVDTEATTSPCSHPIPLQSFFKVGYGGSSIYTPNWCPAVGKFSSLCKPRRLCISSDALMYSGLLNPHFSLADNKECVGPLLDPLPLDGITLWERFFMRYSFCYERPQRLRRFSEQSPSTYHAVTVASLRDSFSSTSQRYFHLAVESEQRHSDEGKRLAATNAGPVECCSCASASHSSPAEGREGLESGQQPFTGCTTNQRITRSQPVIHCGVNRGGGAAFTPPARLAGHHSPVPMGAGDPFLRRSFSHAALCESTYSARGQISRRRSGNNSCGRLEGSECSSGASKSCALRQRDPGQQLTKSRSLPFLDERWSSLRQKAAPAGEESRVGRPFSLTSSLGEGSINSPSGTGTEAIRSQQQTPAVTPPEPAAPRLHGGYESLLDELEEAFDM